MKESSILDKRYSEVIEFLYSQLPVYQRDGSAAYKVGLSNTIELDNLYSNPHKRYRVVHIAGTNGKGSVSHIMASVLQAAGYRVGLYTSPHLVDFRERIKVNGEEISKEAVIDFVDKFRGLKLDLEPSFFEFTVAMAFDHFAESDIDIAVVEVGLGGRLDSTNIVDPELSVITNIGLDHTQFLGTTKGEIALEKGGIIKSNRAVVIGELDVETEPIFSRLAEERSSEIIYAERECLVETINTPDKTHLDNKALDRVLTGYTISTRDCKVATAEPYLSDSVDIMLDLNGIYQKRNLLTAYVALSKLRNLGWNRLDVESLKEGCIDVVKRTSLLGRWQQVSTEPLTICDTGHNREGVKYVVDQLKAESYRTLHIVWGAVNDKDIKSVLELLPLDANYYFCQASIPRALDADELLHLAKGVGLSGESFGSVSLAFEKAMLMSNPDDLIFVGGSTFVVADLLLFLER